MEDVLEVYQRPRDPLRPLLCMDESSLQLLRDSRPSLPMEPGKPCRQDYEYERAGTCNLFLFFEPLEGWRQVKATQQRTRQDWAWAMKELLDGRYAEAEKVVVVMDNLNIHSPASFYEAFDAQEARRLTERLEIHYTPKHGSWLNMAEIELSFLSQQCLDRRLPDHERVQSETRAWFEQRNQGGLRMDWRFTSADARIKLKHLYPSFHA